LECRSERVLQQSFADLKARARKLAAAADATATRLFDAVAASAWRRYSPTYQGEMDRAIVQFEALFGIR
jgi:hypothetical protein